VIVECKITRDRLPAYQDGEMAEAVARNVEEHLTICHACRKADLELKEAWYKLGTWEDDDPPEKIRMEVLSRISKQRKMRWVKIVIPVAAALLIIVGLTLRFTDLEHEKQTQMPLPAAPLQLSAEHSDFDEDELIADLHVLQDEEFYDTLEELVKIDYLPLIDGPQQMERDRKRSSLEVTLT
jgi:hypothetical protein